MSSQHETPAVRRTKAALQQSEGKRIRTSTYAADGIVLYFDDESNLQIDITYEREMVGVQGEPSLMAHFGGRIKK